jgi:solute carrier family 10 (sodium/bile acid cotransporter), member 7
MTNDQQVIRFLDRSWFLLALLTVATLALVAPQEFLWAGHIDPRFVVAPALFLMGWTLPSRSLGRAMLWPWPALWAVAISYGVLPALGWASGVFLAVDDFQVGLLIMLCGPCTLASAILWTRMAGGDDAIALFVVLLTTTSSWLVTPALLLLYTGTIVAVDTRAMMIDLLVTLVVPVSLGQLCRAPQALAHVASRHRRFLSIVSQILILLILLKAVVYVGLRLRAEAGLPGAGVLVVLVAMCLGLHLAAVGAGLWSSGRLRFTRPARVAVAFACSQKTLPVALLVFERYFPQYPLAVVPLVVYHLGQLLVDTFIAQRLHSNGSFVIGHLSFAKDKGPRTNDS